MSVVVAVSAVSVVFVVFVGLVQVLAEDHRDRDVGAVAGLRPQEGFGVGVEVDGSENGLTLEDRVSAVCDAVRIEHRGRRHGGEMQSDARLREFGIAAQ